MTTAASAWHRAGAKSIFTELTDSLRKLAEGVAWLQRASVLQGRCFTPTQDSPRPTNCEWKRRVLLWGRSLFEPVSNLLCFLSLAMEHSRWERFSIPQ